MKSVQLVLSELSMRLFDLFQAWMICMCGYTRASTVCMLLCAVVIVVSFA